MLILKLHYFQNKFNMTELNSTVGAAHVVAMADNENNMDNE